jgi:hypothetical protein
MKPKKFLIEPYKDALFLFCPCSKEEALAWAKRKKIDGELDLDGYEGFDAVTYYSTAGNLIFMHRFEDTPAGLGILVHELCHATFNVLNAKGVKEEAGTEEAAAYLLDNMVEKCVKYLRAQAKKAAEGVPLVDALPLRTDPTDNPYSGVRG